MRTKARLVVDLDLFDSNIKKIKAMAKKSEILLMVKAQAYGFGDKHIIRRAFNYNHINHFGFATILEADKALEYLEDHLFFNYYVFSETGLEDGNLSPEILKIYQNKHILPVVNSERALDSLFEESSLKDKPLVIKFDTGMNRFGFKVKDIDRLAQKLKEKSHGVIHHLMTHFPSASSKKATKLTQSQYQEFLDIKQRFEETGIVVENSSVSNSAAIEREIGVEESFIRPGLLAYGNYSTRENSSNWTGKPIARLEVEPLKFFFARKGTPVGYSSVSMKKDAWLAILPLGYADGLTQSFERAIFTTQLGKAHFHGYMNMDISYLVFDELSESSDPMTLLSEKSITLIGHNAQAVSELSRSINISAYQIYSQLSLRVPRLYKMS